MPQLAQDTIWESDINTRKHHKQENQEVSQSTAGDHEAARNRQDSLLWNTNKKGIHKRSTAFEWSVTKSVEGLNYLTVPTLPLFTEMDQDT